MNESPETLPKPEAGQALAPTAVVCNDLLADGWREYPDQFKKYARCFYKCFDTPSRCHGNDDKPGVQIKIAVSELDGWMNMEMDLCAGLKDETWLTIKNYSLPKTVKEVTALIPRMLAAWESANAPANLPRAGDAEQPKANESGWIAVDLDGTIAHYEGWQGAQHIGAPIAPMLERVKKWLAGGKTIKIFTARMHGHGMPLIGGGVEDAKTPIEEWCRKHIGQVLEVTNVKDFGMIELWDDRAIQVESNTGIPVRHQHEN